MARTAIATLQTIWDCRWSRPGYLPRGLEEPGWPNSLWVCVRPNSAVPARPESAGRRAVTAEECEACRHWQASDEHQDARH